jgi:hypothetical protein
MQADLQKLIAYGKVLGEDEKTLKDFGIKDGDFIVVMISKVCISKCKYDDRPSHLPRKTLSKKRQDQHNKQLEQQHNRIHPLHRHNNQVLQVLKQQELNNHLHRHSNNL